MITVYNFLAGLGGGIIAIVSAIGIPFIRKIIFKLFESKVDERANKAISDHNAKNDTKIHISKALFDLEQQAINNTLNNLGEIITIIIYMYGMTYTDISNKQFSKNDYFEKLFSILEKIVKYNRDTISYFVYVNKNIEDLFDNIYNNFNTYYNDISQFVETNNTNELNTYLGKILNELENYNSNIKRTIREYYNNIKIV